MSPRKTPAAKKARPVKPAQAAMPLAPDTGADTASGKVSRISLSLPAPLLEQLDEMVAARGCASRSQAVTDMVSASLAEHKRVLGNEVMTGTIMLHYDRTVRSLPKQLADIQYAYLDEVISSLHVHLSHDQVMEVILVQGEARQLQKIADELLAQRGVITGGLRLLAALMPPIQMPREAR